MSTATGASWKTAAWPVRSENPALSRRDQRQRSRRLDPGEVILRLTGASLYRVLVNGTFAGHGPARAAHGFYRLDELDIAPHLRAGRNEVVVEVAGYNVNSFYLLGVPGELKKSIDGHNLSITTPDLGPDDAPCKYAYTFKITGAETLAKQ